MNPQKDILSFGMTVLLRADFHGEGLREPLKEDEIQYVVGRRYGDIYLLSNGATLSEVTDYQHVDVLPLPPVQFISVNSLAYQLARKVGMFQLPTRKKIEVLNVPLNSTRRISIGDDVFIIDCSAHLDILDELICKVSNSGLPNKEQVLLEGGALVGPNKVLMSLI